MNEDVFNTATKQMTDLTENCDGSANFDFICTSVDEKYTRTRHVLSASPAVCAYMYASTSSPAYTGDAGSVMKTPPLLPTPLGAVSPLPTVAVRSDASHQPGCP